MCNQIELNKVSEYNIIIDKNNTDVNSLHIEDKYSNDSTDNAKDSNTTAYNDPSHILKEIKAKHENRIVVVHLNINYIYQTFEALKTLVDNNIDILMISETKIDESFPFNFKLIAIETGHSDRHKMILSVLNKYIKKREHTAIHISRKENIL